MPKYKILLHPSLDAQLVRHAEFIARVSKSAAVSFRAEFAGILRRLSENPYQFPPYDDPNLPRDTYRKAIFSKWYKAVFSVEGRTVYVDAVIDGRSDMRRAKK